MRISKLLKLLLAASMPLYATDEDEAGNASAAPSASPISTSTIAASGAEQSAASSDSALSAKDQTKPVLAPESVDSSQTSANNPITVDTMIPTTETPVSTLDTPLDSSSSLSAASLSDSSSAGSSVLSSGEAGNAQASDSVISSDAASQAAISSTPTPTIGDAPSAISASPTSTVNGLEPNGAPSITDTTAETELPGEGVVLPAASSPASDTASSASNALPVGGTADTAADSSLLAAGKAEAAVIPAPVVASTSGGVVGGLLPVAPLPVVEQGNVDAAGAATASSGSAASATDANAVGDNSGNVPAGGVLPADTTSQSTDDEDRHPAVPHLRALRNKIESGEAIIMADLLNLLHRIEESL